MRIMSPYTLKWVRGGDEQNDISALIRESYHQVYHASLSHCMPWLLGMFDANGSLKAACGVHPASLGTLYLEQYLDTPIESTLSEVLALQALRKEVVEIGNFAALDGACARIMYAALCQLLNQYHFSWIVFTGTRKIRNTFYRLNLHPILLMPANPLRLGEAAKEWGDYYRHDPQIMVGELTGGHSTLSQNSLLLTLFNDLPHAPWTNLSGDPHVSELA